MAKLIIIFNLLISLLLLPVVHTFASPYHTDNSIDIEPAMSDCKQLFKSDCHNTDDCCSSAVLSSEQQTPALANAEMPINQITHYFSQPRRLILRPPRTIL